MQQICNSPRRFTLAKENVEVDILNIEV